jgi:hypothetical protein
LLRVLPRMKPLIGQGCPVSYYLELLGDDGHIYSFNLTDSSKSQATQGTAATPSFYQENLNDSFFGSIEWIFQQQNTSKRCDITLEYFPRLLSSWNLKLRATSSCLKSLEEISNPNEISRSLLKCRHRLEELKHLSHQPKSALFEELSGGEGRGGGIRKSFLRSQFSSEQLYSLRRSFTSQVATHSVLSYLLSQSPATPRDLVFSIRNGSLPFQCRPLDQQLSAQRISRKQIPFRLSPTMTEAMTSHESFRSIMGNAAIALEEKKDLVQVQPPCFYCLLLPLTTALCPVLSPL